MTRPALISTITLLALTVASRPASAATAPVTFSGAITDNYKAKYNVPAGTPPNARETRTWLKLQAVAVNGVIYTPATRPAGDGHSYTADEAVVGSDGSSAVVSISSDPGVVSAQFIRTDADGWGPLVYLVDVSTLQSHPVHLTVTVTANGAVVGSSVVDYLWDSGLWNAPPSSDEYFSPGGRWWLGCNPTQTNLELSFGIPAPASTCAAPAADLSVTVSGPGNVNVGDNASLTLTVANAGPAAAANVSLADALPGGLRLQSVTPGAGVSCNTAGPVTCSIATLAAGAQAQVRLGVASVISGSISD